MCATAEVWTAPTRRVDVDALRAFAREHDIFVGDAHETRDGGLHTSLQPLIDGRECCWCPLDDAPLAPADPERVAHYRAGLAAVLRWIAERADEVRFQPDCFDYLQRGEETIAPEDVPLPVMNDGRVLTITVGEVLEESAAE